MKIISSPTQMKDFSKEAKLFKKKIVLIPTMGALHQGHLSLIDVAKKHADICIVSIFVNPTQFAPNEDFSKYPREHEQDLSLCEEKGVDVVFMPNAQDIYPKDFSTYINEEEISQHLCGKSRPKHFRGVTTIVGILFNITLADCAVFGQKDAQQASIIKRMVKNLFMDIDIILAPIYRDENGLAMSSRNRYMDNFERKGASRIYSALNSVKNMIISENCTNIDRVKAHLINEVSNAKVRVIYVDVVDSDTSLPINEVNIGKTRICIAVWYGQTRLIDNIEV